MSNELLQLAWKARLKKGPKMVLVALADAANKDGVCWPSRAVLAARAECAGSSVSRHLRALIDAGVVTQARGRRRAATYQIDTDALRTLQDVSNQDVSKGDISNQDVSLTLVKTSQTETSLKGTLIEPSLTSAIADEHPEARKLCDRLSDLMVANGCTKPTIGKKWLDAARLLLDKDRRPFELAVAVLDWSQDDRFWRANIRSMPTFREKFDQLRLQAEGRDGLTVAARIDSPEAANGWLKDEWRRGRVKAIEERTGIRYPQPDLPMDLPQDRVERWLIDRCREWIATNHDLIIGRLTGKESA